MLGDKLDNTYNSVILSIIQAFVEESNNVYNIYTVEIVIIKCLTYCVTSLASGAVELQET